MDINSVEFYTLAFVVAMALVGWLVGRRERRQPSTFIVPLDVQADDAGGHGDGLGLQVHADGSVVVVRGGLMLADGETVHLVINVADGRCDIVEKKGIKRRGVPRLMQGSARVVCLPAREQWQVRYDSEVTSRWATFRLDNTHPGTLEVDMRY